jgi:dTDP-4-dehydrorhamnose 3,5-epimerase
MNVIETYFPGFKIVEPKVFEDGRGYFYESYNAAKYREAGIDIEFIQDNQSKSSYGVTRGLHYQLNPKAQTKLIRALQGTIWDVVVDLRKNSPTFGRWLGFELSEENKRQLLIPKGFAHGFSVLSEVAVVLYKCDEYYSPADERGIIYNDPFLSIDWKIDTSRMILSAKDMKHPIFEEAEKNFEL